MFSDNTFLASIDFIDFTNRFVSVKSGYWKCLITFVSSRFDIPKNQRNFLCRNIKHFWIERFSQVSATKLKAYFMGKKITNSFFNFKNMIYYGFDYVTRGNPDRKNINKLRQSRYFEKKAQKHYDLFRNAAYFYDAQDQVDTLHLYSVHEEQQHHIEISSVDDNLQLLDSSDDETSSLTFSEYEQQFYHAGLHDVFELRREANSPPHIERYHDPNSDHLNVGNYDFQLPPVPHAPVVQPVVIPLNQFETAQIGTITTTVSGSGFNAEITSQTTTLDEANSSFQPGQSFD